MSDSLDNARSYVEALMAEAQVPVELVGEITLPDLLTMVSTVVDQAIKRNLSDTQQVSDQVVTDTMEMVGTACALIGIQATIQETVGESGLGTEAEPDVELGVSAETVTALLTALMRGQGVSIKVNVED